MTCKAVIGLSSLARIIYLTVIFNTLAIFGNAQSEAYKIQSLLTNSIELKAVEPQSDDFSDLQSLKKKIGRSRVVVLGEISHDDGASMAVRSRLVKFLHQEMGFEVLCWEAGFVGSGFLNAALKDTSVPMNRAVKNLMSGGWDASHNISQLFTYARESWQKGKPLYMAGFDAERPPYGTRNMLSILDTIYKYDPGLKPADSAKKKTIDSLVRGVCGPLFNASMTNLSIAGKKAARDFLIAVADSVDNHPERYFVQTPAVYREFFKFALRSLMKDFAATEAWSISREAVNTLRDKAMADRFMWIYEQLYPGKKIIVWVASGHMIRNGRAISSLDKGMKYDEAVQFGHYLHSYIGKDLYTIVSTTYSGERGIRYPGKEEYKQYEYIKPILPVAKGSYEEIAHQTGKKILFTDLRSLPAQHWLNGEVIAYPFGFIPNKAKWKLVVDAFLFIDLMKPDSRQID